MQTTIAPYEADARTVSVTFEQDGVTHTRSVNACFDEAGAYDEAATASRVAEVALGVANKIALGVITNAPATDSAKDAPTVTVDTAATDSAGTIETATSTAATTSTTASV
ncbi:MAG: hypothetical protein WCD42_14350 [Rhizomicrobium sp.]